MPTAISAILSARGAQRPIFAPDGHSLYYCSDRTGRMQLWRTPVAGGRHEQLTDLDRVGRYAVSPDATRIALGADSGGNERWQILVMPATGGEPRDITATPDRIHHLVDWTPDGSEIVVAANRRDPRYFDFHDFPLDGGEPRCRFQHDGTGDGAAVLPDGALVVRTDRARGDRNHLFLVRPDGRTDRLTPDEPAALHGVPCSQNGSLLVRSDRGRDFVGVARMDLTGGYTPLLAPDADIEAIAACGEHWAYAVNVDGRSELHRVDGGRDTRVAGLPPGAVAIDQFGESLAVAPDGSVAVAWALFDAPIAIWVAPPGADARPAIDLGLAGIDRSDLPDAELVWWPTFDGRRIPGFLLRGRGANGPRPTIVQVHGGPEGQARPLWNPLTVALVAEGFGVLQPNVRGSTGYGRAYQSLDDVRLRMDSVRDLDAAAAWLAGTGAAPADRIGVIGASYGGYMTLAATAFFPERWAAAVSIVGIGNWITFLERTDPWRRPLREAEYGTIEHDRAFLESISPIGRLDAIRAPLMVIHGANDPRVSVYEAEQMVAALRDRGREVAYLRYEDEGHGLAKAANRADAWPKVVEFFRAHLMR